MAAPSPHEAHASEGPSDRVTTRLDPLTGAQTVIARDRQGRPNRPTTDCPFCVGGLEAPEPYRTKAFVNRWPSLNEGCCEVVLFSPDHEASLASMDVADVREVIDLWAQRTAALGQRDDVSYVLVFENHGAEVGATIPHPHGQIFAFDFIPPVPAAELANSAGQCPLCQLPAPGQVVASHGTDRSEWLAWVPEASPHPYGLVLAPRHHIGSLPDLDDASRDALSETLRDALARLNGHFEDEVPYMLWFHQRPTDGAQWPEAHVHAEIVPLWRSTGVPRYVAGGELGSGVFINPIDPAKAAADLRGADR